MARLASMTIMAAGIVLLAYFAWRFPWAHTASVLGTADAGWLVVAALLNMLSLAAKGGSWHLLMRGSARGRLGVATAATFIGAAVGSFGLSVAGEAARLRYVTARTRVALGAAIGAIVASRAVEAVALLALIAAGSSLLGAAPWAHTLRAGALVVLALVALLSSRTVLMPVARRLPVRFQSLAGRWLGAARAHETRGALALALLNWLAQWGAYYAACRAILLPAAATLSLTALVLANVGGVLRLTPGNVGVLQAAFALAAIPHDVPSTRAVAAALLLQAVQIIPVVATGIVLVRLSPARIQPEDEAAAS